MLKTAKIDVIHPENINIAFYVEKEPHRYQCGSVTKLCANL